jgi:hypothetical protein
MWSRNVSALVIVNQEVLVGMILISGVDALNLLIMGVAHQEQLMLIVTVAIGIRTGVLMCRGQTQQLLAVISARQTILLFAVQELLNAQEILDSNAQQTGAAGLILRIVIIVMVGLILGILNG